MDDQYRAELQNTVRSLEVTLQERERVMSEVQQINVIIIFNGDGDVKQIHSMERMCILCVRVCAVGDVMCI